MLKIKLKDLFLGILIGCVLTSTTPVLANTILQQINVVLNGVNVEINGEKLDADSILYNGSTYLPLRKVAESVGKDVEWEQSTMTANIKDKVEEVGNKLVEEVKIIDEKDGIIRIIEKDSDLYYSADYYIADIVNQKDYFFLKFPKQDIELKLCHSKSGKINIDADYYIKYNNDIFISKIYFEEEIIPFINR